jgi:hypothetical protein
VFTEQYCAGQQYCQESQMSQKQWTSTSRIVAIYAAFGIAWIYGADAVLGWLVK